MLAFAALLLVITGCETPRPDSVRSLADQNDPVARDELWRSNLTISQLNSQGAVYESAQTLDYLDSIVKKLYPEVDNSVRIVVARLPGENAFALSNGVVVLHLGLLAALRNEHQLAFVLAHEISHIEAQHGYLGAHLRRNVRTRAHLTDLLMLGSGIGYGYFSDGLQRVSREFEVQADQMAAERLLSAGYDLVHAARFFEVLAGFPNVDHTQLKTHPLHEQRANALLEKAASNELPVSSVTSDVFAELRDTWLRESIQDRIDEADWLAALVIVEHIDDPEFAHCMSGMIYYRMASTLPELFATAVLDQRREQSAPVIPLVVPPSDSANYLFALAKAEFEQLLLLSDKSSCALRGIGLVLHNSGHATQASRYLRAYLAEKPDATDNRYIRRLLHKRAQGL